MNSFVEGAFFAKVFMLVWISLLWRRRPFWTSLSSPVGIFEIIRQTVLLQHHKMLQKFGSACLQRILSRRKFRDKE